PRRFGALLWCDVEPHLHPLLATLGPEPLSAAWTARYLYTRVQKHRIAIKLLIMNNQIVVGVGNIYASEALFLAGLNPLLPSSALSEEACHRLVRAIRQVLRKAIRAGGTTLNDFYRPDGQPGYFRYELQVYARASKPCFVCGALIQKI